MPLLQITGKKGPIAEKKPTPLQKISRRTSIFFHFGKTPEERCLPKGISYFRKGQHEEANAEYEKANGHYEKAVVKYDMAIATDPSCAKAYLSRADAHYKLKRYSNAVLDYNEAQRRNPEYGGDTRLHINLGAAMIGIGDIHGAIEEFNTAIDMDVFCVDAYSNRGKANALLNRNKQAIEDFDTAIKHGNYSDAAIFNDRGKAKEHLGRYEDAEKDYKNAIILDPTNSIFLYNRAIIRHRMKNEEGTVEDLKKALEIDPNYIEAKSLLAIAEPPLEKLRF